MCVRVNVHVCGVFVFEFVGAYLNASVVTSPVYKIPAVLCKHITCALSLSLSLFIKIVTLFCIHAVVLRSFNKYFLKKTMQQHWTMYKCKWFYLRGSNEYVTAWILYIEEEKERQRNFNPSYWHWESRITYSILIHGNTKISSFVLTLKFNGCICKCIPLPAQHTTHRPNHSNWIFFSFPILLLFLIQYYYHLYIQSLESHTGRTHIGLLTFNSNFMSKQKQNLLFVTITGFDIMKKTTTTNVQWFDFFVCLFVSAF